MAQPLSQSSSSYKILLSISLVQLIFTISNQKKSLPNTYKLLPISASPKPIPSQSHLTEIQYYYYNRQPMPYFKPVKTKKRSKRYDKVTHKNKIILLKKVLCDSREIKESAEQLEINYSTAKTIMRKYKHHGSSMNLLVLKGISDWYTEYQVSRQRCSYKQLINNQHYMCGQSQYHEPSPQIDPVLKREEPLSIPPHTHTPQIQILQQVLFDR